MQQRIDLCKFQPKQPYTLASVASSRWHSQTKRGKSKEMFTTDNTHIAKDSCVVKPWNIV